MNQTKAVIFDMDGVIIDSELLGDQHRKEYFSKYGVTFPDGYFEQLRGLPPKPYYAKIVKDFKLPLTIDDFIEHAKKDFIDFLKTQKDLKPVPGVKQLIIQLRDKGYKVAVASSANPKRVEFLIKQFNMEKLFDVVTNSDNVMHGKPAPDIYLYTAKLLQVEPAFCLVIEDAKNGVEAAKAAGMKVIGFAGLPHNKQDLSKTDRIIKSFDELEMSF